MSILYKVSDKQLLKDRNNLFKEIGISSLLNNGFTKAPFKTSWFGEYYKDIDGYIYEFGRISKDNLFESVKVFIVKGDTYIKVFINIFRFSQELSLIDDLKEYEGTNFGVPPNSTTKMRLRSDDYKGPPLFYMLFLPEHKVGSYYTKSGYEAEINKLKKLIKSDMENIDDFVKRWHELHKPNITDWEGNIISRTNL
ncbi:MAG: hypothetical protein ACK5C0_02230 [Candidatus Kapaibacterium sp.]|jgi:hypothetical protein